MESIREIYKIGHGPSSSHTMGPRFAAERFVRRVANKSVAKFEVTLYGSLAATGKGHLTDKAIYEILKPVAPTSIVWKYDVFLEFHPNGMKFKAYDSKGQTVDEWTVYSIGGGDLAEEGKPNTRPDIYKMQTITEIQKWCEKTGRTYWEYVDETEGSNGIWDYLHTVWCAMVKSIERGLEA